MYCVCQFDPGVIGWKVAVVNRVVTSFTLCHHCIACGRVCLQSSVRYSSLFHTDDLSGRLFQGVVTFAAVLCGLHCRRDAGQHFSGDDVGIAWAVVIAQLTVCVMYLRVGLHGPAARHIAAGEIVAAGITTALLVAAAVKSSDALFTSALTLAAVAAFVALPYLYTTNGQGVLPVEHYTERLGVLVLAVVANCVREIILVDPSAIVRCGLMYLLHAALQLH